MSYQVLARKWRPRNFHSMVGQAYVLRMLANALSQQRIHHAYLFTGTRGVGKTTIARIFAKSLNCSQGITADPCGSCSACVAIDKGQFLDLFEVDAASRTKVEDTRDLLENVPYPPVQGRFKIYLIDEVHMLSNHSFNALLKTLEEPPEHVKFLLATTDPKRLPVTILSRCLQFHLKKITPEEIATHLQQICLAENIQTEFPALEKLAKAADGSMRDALSLLDQAIAYGEGSVKEADVNKMLGSVARNDLLPLLDALLTQDGNTLFKAIQGLAERAPDFQQVLEEIISIWHTIAIQQVAPDALACESRLQQFAQQVTPEDVQLYYQIALLGRRDLALNPSPQQSFEMTLLRMLAFQPTKTSASDTNIVPIATKSDEPVTTASPAPIPASIELASEWRDILPKLGLSGMAYALASNCNLIAKVANQIELAVSESHKPMLNSKLKERIADALGQYFKQTIDLKITTTTTELFTPTKQQQQEENDKLAKAQASILQDPQIKKLIDMYDATVEISLSPI